MSKDRPNRRMPVVVTLIVGLMLSIMPLHEGLVPLRPDWLALILIFWAMQLPRTWSVGSAWVVGLILFHRRADQRLDPGLGVLVLVPVLVLVLLVGGVVLGNVEGRAVQLGERGLLLFGILF